VREGFKASEKERPRGRERKKGEEKKEERGAHEEKAKNNSYQSRPRT